MYYVNPYGDCTGNKLEDVEIDSESAVYWKLKPPGFTLYTITADAIFTGVEAEEDHWLVIGDQVHRYPIGCPVKKRLAKK